MSGSDGRWAALSSQNERVVQRNESGASAGGPSGAARSGWAELASQRERLVDAADLEFQPANSSHAGSGMRLVASAA